MEIELRIVEPGSADLMALIAKLDQELCERYPADEVHGLDFADPLIKEVVFVVAYINEVPVACGAIRPLDKHSTELKRFYVDKPYRQMGIAGQILVYLESKSHELNFTTIRLETGLEQPEAINFYKKHGYYQIDAFGEYIDCPSSVCFEKHLPMVKPRVVSIWRYPVKSMLGEEMNACEITAGGLLGDRAYALLDTSTGKLANAKNPQKWPAMFQYRATFIEPAAVAQPLPSIRITFPDGNTGLSTETDLNQRLSNSLNRPVQLTAAKSVDEALFEGYIPDIEELEDRNQTFTAASPKGTFFDEAPVHILTTTTMNQLRSYIPKSRIEARRFRPNLVIDTCENEGEGFVENTWVGKTLRFGPEVRLQIMHPTIRCIMTTLEQADLPRDIDVLRAAIHHNGGGIGVYAAVLQGGTVRRGDLIEFED